MKDIRYWTEMRRNKPTWKRWTIVDICHNVRCPHSIVHKIGDYADRITESAKLGTKVFV